jgi:hypothetical protein
LPPRIGESPLPEEAIVTKHRYGAFESSDLDRSQGIRTVIMTGVATNVCVETLKAKSNSRTRRRPWTKAEHRELKAHSKNRTPVAKISRAMKRTVGALRQQAFALGLPLGHRR